MPENHSVNISAAAGSIPQRPVLLRVMVKRFRGIEALTWYPAAGVNVLLGGGDVGKTTLLDAVALLLSPSNTTQVGQSDYWMGDVSSGFSVEAVVRIPGNSDVLEDLQQTAWPWEWDGKEPLIPDLESEPREDTDPVLVFRVRGTDEFELVYEIVQPSGTTTYLPVGVRRRIGLVWLEGDDRSDRDLRLVYGSALDRLLSDRTLRARLAQGIASEGIEERLSDDARKNLKALDSAFSSRALPSSLGVGLVGGKRLSINALIGLTAKREGYALPLSSWGAGTRRLASIEVASARQATAPISVVDEVERGLEPHRQRALMRALRAGSAQAFVTTHSSVVVAASTGLTVWHLAGPGRIGEVRGAALVHARKDPEAFLSRLTIVAEGATEVGFLRRILEEELGGLALELGVWVTDGGGNDACLGLLEALRDAGLGMAAFVDCEGRYPTKWSVLADHLGPLLHQWDEGSLEENVIPLWPPASLLGLVEDPEGDLTGMRCRTLQERLGCESKSWEALEEAGVDLRETIIQAATGSVPAGTPEEDGKRFSAHAKSWFKNEQGGHELAEKCLQVPIWPQLDPLLRPFLDAVRDSAGVLRREPDTDHE